MNDQAQGLRNQLKSMDSRRKTKTLAVISGKGGVGKSNFSLNFAISLAKRGNAVLLFDMDIGMGNLDILMGQTPDYSIVDFINQNVSLKDVIMKGLNNLDVIAGGTGLSQLVKMDKEETSRFMGELSLLLVNYDYIIFDMGAGASDEALNIILSVDEVVVITTSEPTSITDAYAMMKYIHLLNQSIPFYIVVNRVQSEKEGKDTMRRLQTVVKQFLEKDTSAFGLIPEDRSIHQAVKRQIPYTLFNANSPATKAILDITERYVNDNLNQSQSSSAFRFVSKLKQFLFER
ncbi:MinD/ParA family protein [Bacillus massilinigeriensis]|uniref:MinD/ParA family protein n=1 Tax=Bacillus massilionigeriensis TaxID=1805475 RepID=UPI00096ADEA9|nr:MinD/ParA family protein [Bacillus massilionigeriensis]